MYRDLPAPLGILYSSIGDVSCVDIAVGTVQDRPVYGDVNVENNKKIGRFWELVHLITSLGTTLSVYSWLLA